MNMPRRLPPLAALRAFEAAARHLSFKRAAAELHVTATAISHHVRLLEDTIGVRLFERRPRRVAMTAEAQVLFPVLRDGFDSFATALESIGRKHAPAAVTLSATMAFTAKWLVPRMAAFRSACSGIDLKVLATDEPVDLEAGVADLAVRYGPEPASGLAAERLLVDRFAPVASPRLGVRKPSDLKAAMLLHFDWSRSDPANPTWPRWLAAARVRGIDAHAGMRFSDESHAIQAAIAGHGVALLSLTLVADELAAGTLVVPFGPELRGHSYYLVHSNARALSEPARAVRSWILAELRTSRSSQPISLGLKPARV
jgi:LysR family transcriptional regulator, glycine cleavage system transcriptional activator